MGSVARSPFCYGTAECTVWRWVRGRLVAAVLAADKSLTLVAPSLLRARPSESDTEENQTTEEKKSKRRTPPTRKGPRRRLYARAQIFSALMAASFWESLVSVVPAHTQKKAEGKKKKEDPLVGGRPRRRTILFFFYSCLFSWSPARADRRAPEEEKKQAKQQRDPRGRGPDVKGKKK